MRKTWLQLARKDPNLLSEKSRLYFCDDHFDLENDMENYAEYKIKGSVKEIIMKPHCTPSRFDCQANRKRHSNEPLLSNVKKKKKLFTESEKDLIDKDNVTASSSCVEDLQAGENIFYPNNKCDKATQISVIQEHKATHVVKIQQNKAIQVCLKAQYRSKQVQACVKNKHKTTSPFKFTVTSVTSPTNISMERAIQPSTSSTVTQKLVFNEQNYERDISCRPSLSGSTDPKLVHRKNESD